MHGRLLRVDPLAAALAGLIDEVSGVHAVVRVGAVRALVPVEAGEVVAGMAVASCAHA